MVWTTALMFFQGALFLGYIYAHVLSTRLNFNKQILVHLLIALAALVSLPFTVQVYPELINTTPSLALIIMLAASIGLPYFIVCTTSPLSQRWLAHIGTEKTPDLLYSVSNTGSLLALFAYPILIGSRHSAHRSERFNYTLYY